MDPFAVLQLLNVTVELRSSEGSRWLPLKKAVDENGTLLIHPGEVLTRIRIPFETWDIQEYVKVGRNSLEDEQHLSFCSLIKTQKEVINEFKFAFSVLGTVPIRDWSIEAELIGKRIPLTEKNYKLIMDLCDKLLENHREQMSGFQRDRARHIMKHFLLGLSSE
jgi:CO/xanthine dehydrogenase FAD-binding subunit